jgi:shikimate dehydrogenase
VIFDLLGDLPLIAAVSGATLVVNATSLGLHGEHLPAPLETLDPEQAAYDLVYGQVTPSRAAARSTGSAAHDGLGKLVHQAAAAFERWTGTEAPIEVMRAAVTSA